MSVREISTSPGLSSPPSPADSDGHPTPPPFLNHIDAAVFARKESNSYLTGDKSNKLVSNQIVSTSVPKKPNKKKAPGATSHHNNSNNASSATITDEQPTKTTPKPRAKRGTSEAFKKRQRQKAEAEAKAQEEAEALAKINASSPNNSLTTTHYVPTTSVTPHQNGNYEAIHTSRIHAQTSPPTSRAASGQNYDPIRSSTTVPQPISPTTSLSKSQPPFMHSSASASPAIYSITDGPNNPYPFPPPPKRESESRASAAPELKRSRLSPPPPIAPQHQQSIQPMPKDSISALPDLLVANKRQSIDLDTGKAPAAPSNTVESNKKPSPRTSTAVSSSSHSPKPTRPKDTSISVPSGSGLLSGSVFGNGYDSSEPGKTAPTVVLNVPLTSDHQYVNFTRLAEERYGFNALHPRLAAQRDRLARVAAAGAALENAHRQGGNSGSADDMSLDLSDGEADNSNVEMGGTNDSEKFTGTRSGEETGEAGLPKQRRKRMMKEDFYDKEDDFIDDTELIWEEQAATSKDGFFVYSGPLIPAGEEPSVERYVK